MSDIKTFCIAHKPVVFPLPDDAEIIWLGNAEPQAQGRHRVWPIGAIAPEFDAWHAFLSGAAGTFGIEKLLREQTIAWRAGDRVSITSYRKFNAPRPIGPPASNYPGMHIPRPADLVGFDLAAIQAGIGARYLLAKPLALQGGVYRHYAAVHHAPDLLRFLAIAIELNVIDGEQSAELMGSPLLIPGGVEIGVTPVEVFLDIVAKLRLTSLRFLDLHRPYSFDPHQRRAIAFCNERLSSYLLIRHLNSEFENNIPEHLFGHMHNVSEAEGHVPG